MIGTLKEHFGDTCNICGLFWAKWMYKGLAFCSYCRRDREADILTATSVPPSPPKRPGKAKKNPTNESVEIITNDEPSEAIQPAVEAPLPSGSGDSEKE